MTSVDIRYHSPSSLIAVSSPTVTRRHAEAVCPHPRPISPVHPPLAGQLVVFTGKLSSLGRKDARALVARLGGDTADDVNAKTTMLVVGAEGFGRRGDRERARQAETRRRAERRGAGARSRSLSEEEFCRLAGVPTPEALKRQYHAMRDLLARYRSLREDHLRYS